jgi:hypothetical protein
MPNPPSLSSTGRRFANAAHGRRARPSMAATACVIALALTASAARADICKYTDPDGNTHYSNLPPERGWKRVSCTLGDNSTQGSVTSGSRASAPAVSSTAARSSPTPPGFPKVDTQTQRGRDDVRRKVLGDELATEEKLLAEARTAYADGAPPPLPDERTDAEKYRARIAKLRQSLGVHEKNVEALKKELASVR